ncbi:galactolipase DONGLE, chloroplastic-like [Apium graveolens]|uniref:galactolipase DONGLE, chloroplastic-like n=1 Tax=Apium graveolens TaxID=4045 RepID=UPI003D79E305
MVMTVVNMVNSYINFHSLPSLKPLASSIEHTSSTTFTGCRRMETKVAHTKRTLSLAHSWRQIQGFNNWENLIEPLNPLLQQEIVRYGEFAAACYKAFDLNPRSKRYMKCKYGKDTMLENVGMKDSGYNITKYIYVTPDIDIPAHDICGRWIGYVGVSTDEETKRLGRRDFLFAFRGTVSYPEWLANLMHSLVLARFDPNDSRPDVKVEAGFLNLYTSGEKDNKFTSGSCREQLLSEVQRLLKKYEGEEISITLAGHSMGSSLALLLAYDIAELELNRDGSNNVIPITVFSFAGPRVGNVGLKKRCEELGIKVLRIVNAKDPITKMPGIFLNEKISHFGWKTELPWSLSCYVHVGVEIALDFFVMDKPICVHDLETYIEFLKCPKLREMQKQGVDCFEEFIANAHSKFRQYWRNAAKSMVNISPFSTLVCYWWIAAYIDLQMSGCLSC